MRVASYRPKCLKSLQTCSNASLPAIFRMRANLPVVVLLCASLLWGLLWLPNKYVHAAGVDGLQMIAIAYGGIGVLLLPWLVRQRAQWMRDLRGMSAILVMGGAASVTFNAALIYGDVVRAMVLFYLLPVWGVLGGRLFLGERIDWQRALSMMLALLGAFLLLGASLDLFSEFSGADLIALASGFFYAMSNILFRGTTTLPFISKIAVMSIGGALIALLIMAVGSSPAAPVTASGIAMSLGVGLTFLLLAMLGSQWAVTKMDAGRSSVIMVMELVTAVISAAALGESVLHTHEIAGVVLVLLATLLESWRSDDIADAPAAD
jgi:drug/metabolite transporter (DMT)-like permease